MIKPYSLKRTYKVGVVGAGNVTKMHLEGLKRHPELVEITAICDPNQQTLTERADAYDIPKRFLKLEDFIKDSGIDVAVICTPSFLRKEILVPLFEAQIPVFCEKPVGETYEIAYEIAELADQYNAKIAVDQNFRRFFTFDLAREALRDSDLGQARHIVQVVNGWRRTEGWRMDRDRYVMAIMSNHWFDGYRYLLNDEPETIYCQALHSFDNNADTAVSINMQFKKGTVVSLNESFDSFTKLNGATVDCERGGLIMDYKQLVTVDQTGNETKIVNPYDKSEATFYLLYDLLRSIEENQEPETGIKDNLKSIKIFEAAYLSMARNQVVKVGDIG
jgi:predicted dehydrogenase